MRLVVGEEPGISLAEYEAIPISFRVERILKLADSQHDIAFVEEELAKPFIKEYDTLRNRPRDWPKSWDLSTWGFLTARDGDQLVGGAAIAWRVPGMDMLEGRDDLAVLWDIRVRPEYRGRGVGTALFQRAADWARERGAISLKIETQDINVPACRFYAAQGCVLSATNKHAYPTLPHEVQLFWTLAL